MGRAEDLFAKIEKNGESAIEALISEQASEELFLDFKRSADNGEGHKLHDRDRENLKKSVGGFANSEGGIIVWGINCSSSSIDGDTASAKVPIKSPRRFVSWIEGAISGLTVPPVVGVRSIAIQANIDYGYVVTLIPKSNHAPHQLSGEGKYVIRAGSNFVPAPHGVVAGLFGKAPQPIVFPNFKISTARILEKNINGVSQLVLRADMTFVLVNDGNVVAEDIFATFKCFLEKGIYFSGAKKGWDRTSGFGFDVSYLTNQNLRLAPRASIEVCDIAIEIDDSINFDYKMQITAGCKGAVPFEQTYFVSLAELHRIKAEAISILKDGSTSPNTQSHKITQNIFGLKDPN